MKHADIRRALADRISGLLSSNHQFPITLRPYQLETLASLRAWLSDENASHRGYVEQATGLGKTALFASLAAVCVGLKLLIIVPTKLLVEQTAKEVVKFTGGMLGHLSGLKTIKDERGRAIAIRGHDFCDIVITTDETFASRPRRIVAEYNPEVVIFDECHWGLTGRAKWALEAFSESVIVGFSATPDYFTTTAKPDFLPITLENGQTLYAPKDRLAESVFGTMIDRRSAAWGIAEGYLAPLAWGRIEFDASLKDLPVGETEAGLDYQPVALQRFMEKHWSDTTRAVRNLYQSGQYGLMGRQVFAVCPTIRSANELSECIKLLGIPAASVSSETPPDARRRILAAYAANEIRLLTSVVVLREGWDAPNAEVCLMLRPTKSYVLYVQIMGRVLRPLPGKEKVALVLDGHFQDTAFAPLAAPALFAPIGSEVFSGEIFLRARTGAPGPARAPSVSPYRSEHFPSERHLVERIAVERYAGRDGIFTADGEEWATDFGAADRMRLPFLVLQSSGIFRRVRARKAKDARGKETVFYALSDIAALVAR